MSRKYAVETDFNGFWENCWNETSEDGTESLQEFDSIEAAEAELADHLAAMRDAVDLGYMQDMPNADEFRVVSV